MEPQHENSKEHIMPPEVTKEDITEIFKKMDAHAEQLTQIRIQQALIKQTVESIPKPAARPCIHFIEHMAEHKESATTIKKPIINSVIGAAFVVIGIILKGFYEWAKIKINTP